MTYRQKIIQKLMGSYRELEEAKEKADGRTDRIIIIAQINGFLQAFNEILDIKE